MHHAVHYLFRNVNCDVVAADAEVQMTLTHVSRMVNYCHPLLQPVPLARHSGHVTTHHSGFLLNSGIHKASSVYIP